MSRSREIESIEVGTVDPTPIVLLPESRSSAGPGGIGLAARIFLDADVLTAGDVIETTPSSFYRRGTGLAARGV
jgi:hypothetical protein